MTTNGQDENVESTEARDSRLRTNGSGSEKPVTSSSVVRRGTGPRTRQGKEKSKYNALKYGIFSEVVVLKGESQAEVEALLNELRDYLQPEGAFEEILVDKLTALFWRQRRLLVAEREAGGWLERGFWEFNEGSPQLDLLLRCETTSDRAIDRVLAQLERYQRMRRGQPVAPRIDLNLSSS